MLNQEEAKALYLLILACWLKGSGHDICVETDTKELPELIERLRREAKREDNGFGEGRL